MKDTIVTARAKRRELLILLGCFVAANLVNVAAIIRYGTRWTEVFTQLGYVVCITVIFYAVVVIIRLIIGWLRRNRRRE